MLDTTPPPPPTNDQRLEEILYHLKRMDRRDSLRMWGSFAHSLIIIVPFIIFLMSAWYLYANKDVLLKSLGQSVAEQAGNAAASKGNDALNGLKSLFGN